MLTFSWKIICIFFYFKKVILGDHWNTEVKIFSVLSLIHLNFILKFKMILLFIHSFILYTLFCCDVTNWMILSYLPPYEDVSDTRSVSFHVLYFAQMCIMPKNNLRKIFLKLTRRSSKEPLSILKVLHTKTQIKKWYGVFFCLLN